MTKAIYQEIIKPNRDVAFAIVCKETVPLFCSEGEMTNPICQGMIGYALTESWMVANSKLINKAIPSSKSKFEYVAYLSTNKSDDPVKVSLGKSWKKAVKTYENYTEGDDAKYLVGIIGHSAH